MSDFLEVEHVGRRLVLERARFFQVLPQLLQVNRVLLPQSLHLCDGFSLVNDEFLVPSRRKGFELVAVLLLDLDFFAGMLVIERNLKALLCFLTDLHNSLELLLRLRELTGLLVEDSLGVERLQVILDIVDVWCPVLCLDMRHQVVILLRALRLFELHKLDLALSVSASSVGALGHC